MAALEGASGDYEFGFSVSFWFVFCFQKIAHNIFAFFILWKRPSQTFSSQISYDQ
jgi:hypothetical protein